MSHKLKPPVMCFCVRLCIQKVDKYIYKGINFVT